MVICWQVLPSAVSGTDDAAGVLLRTVGVGAETTPEPVQSGRVGTMPLTPVVRARWDAHAAVRCRRMFPPASPRHMPCRWTAYDLNHPASYGNTGQGNVWASPESYGLVGKVRQLPTMRVS